MVFGFLKREIEKVRERRGMVFKDKMEKNINNFFFKLYEMTYYPSVNVYI